MACLQPIFLPGLIPAGYKLVKHNMQNIKNTRISFSISSNWYKNYTNINLKFESSTSFLKLSILWTSSTNLTAGFAADVHSNQYVILMQGNAQ